LKIFSAPQIRAWDAFTIANEPIASINLMERAAQQCTDWLLSQWGEGKTYKIFCGKGNNGGDGLAMARQLYQKGMETFVYILEFGKIGSTDFQHNLQQLNNLPVNITFLQSEDHFPAIDKNEIVIDALYGSGLNQPLDGLSASLVKHINNSDTNVVAIDIPSGLFMDASSVGNEIIKAHFTLTFETYKLAQLVAENAPYIGEVVILPIGLHKDYEKEETAPYTLLTLKGISDVFKKRNRFAHKGSFGHALLVGGSWGKTGAMVLASKAALRAGCGLLTTYVPRSSYTILQTTVPEAMTLTDKNENYISHAPEDLQHFKAIGIGPGMGTLDETELVLEQIVLHAKVPLVLDADALNLLAQAKRVLRSLPHQTILTPHPKEADRLFGASANDFDRIKLVQKKAADLQCVIVLKGHHTLIALPDGTAYFNSTGNAGMAKGGSGDVLTGIITALLAQGYAPDKAALLGVYLHGLAGDLAVTDLSMEALLPTDMVEKLPQAFAYLHQQPVK